MTETRRHFEEWALLSPRLSTEKDGDGEYESEATRKYYACFEYAFKKGAFSGAGEMQRLCDIDYDKLAKHDRLQAQLDAALADPVEMEITKAAKAINIDWKRQFDGQPISNNHYDATIWTATGKITNLSELAQSAINAFLQTRRNKMGVE